MRLKTCRKHPTISTRVIQTWYMKHVFKDIRCSWRCMSFARVRRRSHQAQQRMARRISLQRAQSRAAASRTSQSPVRHTSHRWMCKSFSALYSHSQRRFRTRDKLSRLKNRILGSDSLNHDDPTSSSSLADLIPQASFDLENVARSSTDSDERPSGLPPSRRSSDSLLSNNRESSTAPSPAAGRSPFSALRQHRRKRSVFRAAKLALSGRSNSNGWERSAQQDSRVTATGSIGIGRSKYTHGIETIKEKLGASNRTLPTPENLSRGTSMTMDTSSSPYKSPTKSVSPNWHENNYDALTETLSVSSWGTTMRGDPFLVEARRSERRPSVSRSVGSVPHGHDKHDWLPRQELTLKPKPGSRRMAPPAWSEDLHRRQASAIKGAIHALPGKDFQEAIVDIILENDVQDLVDLEEFLQDYFRLNSLYQNIIQQFFNDLSGDVVHAQVSKAPSVIARLASGNGVSGRHRNSTSARKSVSRRI